MKLRSPLIFLISLASAMAGVTGDKPSLHNFLILLGDTDTIEVYEGLPHPIFEREALEAEKRAKKVFSVSDAFFYEEPLGVSEEDRRALDHLFRTATVCVPFRGEKFCGGFHADYMIEWKKKGERAAAALLCFGCHEIVVIAGERSQRTDMSKVAFDALSPLLKKYRKECPLSKNGAQLKPVKQEPMTLPAPRSK